MKTFVDIIIKNGQVLTINQSMDVITDGVVIIKDKKILDVGTFEILEKYISDTIIDAHKGIIMPGMVNTHCHLPMIAFRGLGEEGGIENRLIDYFLPLENKLLSRELIYKSTLFGAMDMLLSGVTTFADMYYHIDEMVKATDQIGIRSVLGQTVIGFPVVDADKPYGGLAYAEKILDLFSDNELSKLAIAPHAPYTVDSKNLILCKEFAEKNNLLIHTHCAEFISEPFQIKDNLKKNSTVEYLEDIGFLGENVLLAHCNHISEKDIEILSKNNCRVAHNPMANMKGATGMCPAKEIIDENIRLGLGTDGPMGSNVIDLFNVMTFTSCVQRIRKMDEAIMPPELIVRTATIGGAEALGLNKIIGSIEQGKLADIIILECNSLNMIPNFNPYATLVYQANPSNVVTTIVNGKILVNDRKLTSIKKDEILEDMKYIFSSVENLGKQLAINAKK